jgi:zinc protease
MLASLGIPLLSLVGALSMSHPSAAEPHPAFLPLNLPGFVREDLPNGMVLLAAENREQPVLFLTLLIRAGSFHDPEGKEGLASVVAEMLPEGTEKHDSAALARTIDLLGGRFSVHADAEMMWADMQILSKNREESLDLLAEVLRQPTFPKPALRRVKQQQRAMVRTGYASADFVGLRHLNAMMYGRHLPPGRFPTDRSLGRIRESDVRGFYQGHVHAGNALLAAIGDGDAREMLQAMKKRFADWEARSPSRPFDLPPNFQCPSHRRLVVKKDLSQVTILLGGSGVSVLANDFDRFRLANHILGASGFSSRLMEAVRSQQGKTYGIHSENLAWSSFGSFRVQTFTRNEQVTETVNLVRSVIRDAAGKGLTEDELAKAKTALIGGFPLRFEVPSSWARSALSNLFLGRPMDYALGSRERIARVTLDEVNEVLRRVVDADRLHLVIVGDPKRLKGRIESLGPLDVRKEKDDWY